MTAIATDTLAVAGADVVGLIGAGTPAVESVVVAEPDAEHVVRAAPMLITVTPSVEGVLHGEWLTGGQHVSAVGARPRADERELDTAAMHLADLVVVDNRGSIAAESGDHRLAADPRSRTCRASTPSSPTCCEGTARAHR